MPRPLMLAALSAVFVAGPAFAQDAADAAARLNQRLVAVDANAQFNGMAAYERLQARQAIAALAEAPSRERQAALYVAERRVEAAEIAARTQAMQREVERLDRERAELMLEASRQDAARARAEAERLRMEAQLQAEETARLRAQAEAERQDVETALEGVAGAQEAKLNAARARQLELARKEAELMTGGKLPASKVDARGEVFTLAGDSFASGKASLTPAAMSAVKTLSVYLQAIEGGRARVEGHTDSQGSAAANRSLSQQRANAVRDALVAAGLPDVRVQATGLGADRPVGDNRTEAGRAANRRVEVILLSK